LREFVIFTLLTLMLMGLGYLVGLFIGSPEVLTLFALIVASLMNLLAYFYGDSLVLKMTNAKLIDKSKAPRLYRIVEKVSQKMNLPTPKIGIVPTLSPNAFATGRDPQHSIVCVTEGALRLLDDEELEGVIGHELSHIKHRDTLIASIAATLVGALSYIAFIGRYALFFGTGERREANPAGLLLFLIGLIFIPIAAVLLQMAISRGREFYADEESAKVTEKPLSLASALQKIEKAVKHGYTIKANPATSHLWISNPFSGDLMAELFSTHPSTRRRIERLKLIARELGQL